MLRFIWVLATLLSTCSYRELFLWLLLFTINKNSLCNRCSLIEVVIIDIVQFHTFCLRSWVDEISLSIYSTTFVQIRWHVEFILTWSIESYCKIIVHLQNINYCLKSVICLKLSIHEMNTYIRWLDTCYL